MKGEVILVSKASTVEEAAEEMRDFIDEGVKESYKCNDDEISYDECRRRCSIRLMKKGIRVTCLLGVSTMTYKGLDPKEVFAYCQDKLHLFEKRVPK